MNFKPIFCAIIFLQLGTPALGQPPVSERQSPPASAQQASPSSEQQSSPVPDQQAATAPGQQASPAAGRQSSLNLNQCYELAKKQSETLKIQDEQIEQITQQFRQVLGNILPAVGFNASQRYQKPGGGGGAVFSPTSNPQVNFTLNQPLFSGFKEYAAMSVYKHQGKSAELLLDHASRSLFLDVSNAFYLVLNLEKNLEDIHALQAMTEERVKELKEREQLGKSRLSEVRSVESQLATVKSQAQGIRGQIAAARELLSFLIGQDASETLLEDELPDQPELGPQDAALQRAQTRSDVRAADESAMAQYGQVKIAQGNWYPTVGFTGNYYLKRIPALEPIKWDAMFSLNLPLFSGGTTLAQVRQAKSRWRAAEDSASLVLRQARTQIRTDYLALQSALAQWQILKEAYEKAQESYIMEVREYRLGIVDNLTVLQEMNTMQAAKLSMDQTSYQIKTAYLQLKTATEDLP